MVTYKIETRQSRSGRVIGGLLDRVGLGGLNPCSEKITFIPVSSTELEADARKRKKRSRSKRHNGPGSTDPYTEPFLPEDLYIPPGMKPLDYRMAAISHKLDWLAWKNAAAPPPAKPQAPKLCFNDLVQRDVYDKGMHKPLIGRRCSKEYECSLCAA